MLAVITIQKAKLFNGWLVRAGVTFSEELALCPSCRLLGETRNKGEEEMKSPTVTCVVRRYHY